MPSIGFLCIGSFYSFIFLTYNRSPEKVTFSGTQKPIPPTVFNLLASDWVHCEEETGAYYQLSRFTYKLVKKKLSCLYFAKKIRAFQKIQYNLLFISFQKEIIRHTYICTKCNNDFKFTLSLKSSEE